MSGVVILASNLKANIDQAFARRFQAVILFPMPDAEARRDLWKLCFEEAGGTMKLGKDVDLDRIARDHEMSGGSIVNVLRHAGIQAAKSGEPVVGLRDLNDGLRRETRKEGRITSA